MYTGHHVEDPLLFCHILIKLEFSRQFFEKSSNTKFHKTPSSCSRADPCGNTDGQTWRSY